MTAGRKVAALGVALVLAALLTWSDLSSVNANPLADAGSVSAGDAQACLVTTTGAAKCWGNNNLGLLGNGSTANSSIPVDVVGLSSGISAISTSAAHTCALMATGSVKCWGDNDDGRLGDETTGDSLVPVDVIGLTGVTDITTGNGPGHTCALTTEGGVKCWGTGYTPSPSDVTGLTTEVAAVAAGGIHTCALMTSGGVKCWGDNEDGQLGDGGACGTFCPTPVDVVGLTTGVAAIASGSLHSCAVTLGGAVKCWGSNPNGVLGDGTTTHSSVPVDVVGLSSGATDVDAGTAMTCALLNTGGVNCWGGTFGALPVDVLEISSATSVSVGSDFACATLVTTVAQCWGNNGSGQLGDGTTISRTDPADVVDLAAKPTPTDTPCGPEGCPTPTPTPICPTEACMALAVLESGEESCHSDTDTVCTIPTGAEFVLAVDAVQPPKDGYTLVQASLSFGSDLIYHEAASKAEELVWPDSVVNVRAFHDDILTIGGITGVVPPLPVSTYAGIVMALDFTCSASASTTNVTLIPYSQTTAGAVFSLEDRSQVEPTIGSLTINCNGFAPAVGGAALSGIRPLEKEETHRTTVLLVSAIVVGLLSLSGVLVGRRYRQL